MSPVQEPWATTGNLCAQVRETHTGVVVLLGDKAYKVKKSVTTDFLDFSTTDGRERACEHEVALKSGVRLQLSRRYRKRLQKRMDSMSARG